MKDAANLQLAMRRARELALPPGLWKVVEQEVNRRAISAPDQGQISRARLSLDVSVMSWKRALHARACADRDRLGSVRYLTLDSSPQYHRDYELAIVRSICRSSLPDALMANYALHETWARDEEEDDWEVLRQV